MADRVNIIINPGMKGPSDQDGDNAEAETPARASLIPGTSPKDPAKKVVVKGLPNGILGKHAALAYVNESASFSVADFKPELEKFVDFCLAELELDIVPTIILKDTEEFSTDVGTFATFNLNSEETTVAITNRHPMDVLRSIAHELVHLKQLKEGRLKIEDGKTGSDVENEANSKAGIIMRKWAGKVPKMFGKGAVRKHIINSKKKYHLATTGGNNDEYEDPVEESINETSVEYRTKYLKKAENDIESRHAKDKDDPKILKREKATVKAMKRTPLSVKESTFITNKSAQFAIPQDILEEVYRRGLDAWENTPKTLEASQYAFNRMNSFIAGGLAMDMDDDLVSEETFTINEKTSNKALEKLAKRSDGLGSKAKDEITGRAEGGRNNTHQPMPHASTVPYAPETPVSKWVRKKLANTPPGDKAPVVPHQTKQILTQKPQEPKLLAQDERAKVARLYTMRKGYMDGKVSDSAVHAELRKHYTPERAKHELMTLQASKKETRDG